jgi:hypothetical protein
MFQRIAELMQLGGGKRSLQMQLDPGLLGVGQNLPQDVPDLPAFPFGLDSRRVDER